MANLERKSIRYSVLFKYDFSSLDDFLNELITKKINERIFQIPVSFAGSKSFTGTNSFEEAWNLCKYTCDDGYKKFSSLVDRIQFKYENYERYIQKYKPTGYSASVPRFLCGIPDNMRSREKVYDKPVINLYFQYVYNCNVTKGQVRNRGILTLALINYLENIKNYNVNFNFIAVIKNASEIIYISIKLKDKDEKLKIKKCYFPIVHPSFARRLTFRAIEIIPYLQTDWSYGYGRALDYKDAKNYIYDEEVGRAIYISTPDELGIKGKSIEEDAENFIEIINLKYNFLNDKDVKKNGRRRL